MTAPFAIGTFSHCDERRFAGLVRDDRVVRLRDAIAGRPSCALPAEVSVFELLTGWQQFEPMLVNLVNSSEAGVDWSDAIPLTDMIVHPPVDLPRQIFCTGANYRKHVVDLTLDMNVGPENLTGDELRRWAENMMDERAATGEPYVFTKPVSAVCGAFDVIPLPATTSKPDWELELGVVIGEGGYRISRDDALSHVAGYAIVNDISARDLIARTDYKMLGTDWLRAKGQPGFLPFGPYLVPARFVLDPQALQMRLTVAGKVMQDESTADMLFNVARQIEYISTYVKLLPGDLICTGSPAGNGTHYGRFLQPGDEMVGEIEGLGEQRARCESA